MMITLKNLCV